MSEVLNVAVLKQKIIEAGVTGKLVPHIASEGTAEELLKQIEAERTALIKAGKIKKGKQLPKITEDEVPFEIPKSWKWVRLGGLIQLISGRDLEKNQYSDINKGYPYLTGASNIVDGELVIERWTEKPEVIAERGDILLSCKGTVGKVLILEFDKIHIARQIMAIRPLFGIDRPYLKYFILSLTGVLTDIAQGLIPGISREDILNRMFPLPPLSEQKRIVAKIEELITEIDNIDRLQSAYTANQGGLKKKIIEAGITGKLVPQIASEGTAEELVSNLKSEKIKLVNCGKINKKKELPALNTNTVPFKIPSNWRWVYLSDVSIIQEGAGILKSQYSNSGIQLFSVSNILDGAIDLKKKELYVSKDEYSKKYTHLTLNKGDIVTACSGGSWGKVAIYNEEDVVMLNTSTLRLRFFSDLSYNKYLYYLVTSSMFKKQLEVQLVGMQPNFGYAHYSKILIPLPPLSEQKRIVAKIEELLQIVKN